MELKTARQVIDALGGPYVVAKLFADNMDVRVVFNWRRRRLPPDTYAVLSQALTMRRIDVDPAVFGQRRAVWDLQARKDKGK
jgi:hypothetical protein